MTEQQLNDIEARANAATNGPWRVWDGHDFVGGGADLCIGSGDEWLANMDHRYSEAHLAGQCMAKDSVDICSLSDAESITNEQRNTADFIAAARMDVPALVAEVRRLQREAGMATRRIVTCIYCGHEYRGGTPTSQDNRLTAHIRQCEKHPMRALEKEASELRKQLERERRDAAKAEQDAYRNGYDDAMYERVGSSDSL